MGSVFLRGSVTLSYHCFLRLGSILEVGAGGALVWESFWPEAEPPTPGVCPSVLGLQGKWQQPHPTPNNSQGQRDTHSPGGLGQGPPIPLDFSPCFSLTSLVNSCGLQWSESEWETEAGDPVLAQVTQLRQF